ncbi:MAG: deoxyuridine 5'-triphosphate nucleotidohydrolase [Erysipelotrichaceae bacterium]|nr:deoxyuridine 5'-triphosphate nucleotidohydrolase [Erysipelotrichaceae bacterium]
MKIARFAKVSPEQFESDANKLLPGHETDYDGIVLPKRATSGSAGYDFYSPFTISLKPGESIRVPSGIRCRIDDGYVLEIYPRSSLGFKYQMGLLNTTGIIDADYYNADNEGHIIVGIVNRGDKTLLINAGDRFVHGIFKRYYLAEETEIDTLRHGGFGSTD